MNQAWCLNISSLALSRLNYQGLFRLDKNTNWVLNWSKINNISVISIILLVYDSFFWSDFQLILILRCCCCKYMNVLHRNVYQWTVFGHCKFRWWSMCVLCVCGFDYRESRIVWNNKEHVPRPWIEHGASRSSVLRSPNWAIEAYVFTKRFYYTWYTHKH